MRRIAVINQKGGVGKTTTTVNLGAALARLGERVLVGDLDAQCNLTVHLDMDPASEQASLYDVFHGRTPLADAIQGTRQPRLDVAPASIDLAGIELELVNAVGREVILRDALDALEEQHPGTYDYLLLDCPPSLGLVSLNALVACDELVVPIQAEFFALQGLGKLLEIVEVVRRRLNPNLRIAAMVSCRHDPTTKLGKQVIGDIRAHFGDILLQTVIRRNVKLAEAPSHGCTIFEYDDQCRGAQDYLSLARELVGELGDQQVAAPTSPDAQDVLDSAMGGAPERSEAPQSRPQSRPQTQPQTQPQTEAAPDEGVDAPVGERSASPADPRGDEHADERGHPGADGLPAGRADDRADDGEEGRADGRADEREDQHAGERTDEREDQHADVRADEHAESRADERSDQPPGVTFSAASGPADPAGAEAQAPTDAAHPGPGVAPRTSSSPAAWRPPVRELDSAESQREQAREAAAGDDPRWGSPRDT